MPLKLGYARISTKDQSFDLQIDALQKAGCSKIYQEVVSGAKSERKELTAILEHCREGDSIVVWKLDRLGRSLRHLVELVNTLIEKRIGLISLNDPVDTTTAQGRLCFNIFSSLAEFEREMIRERTQTGLSAAKSRGRNGGRPKGLSESAEATAYAAETLYLERKLGVQQIADKLNISKKTLYSYLRRRNVPISAYQSN